MPLIQIGKTDPSTDGRQSERALDIRSGVLAGLQPTGDVFLAEFTLPNGRRADLIGLSEDGQISIIEIKSSVTDFAVDEKWPDYLEFCDRFYFASHADVPMEIFPDDEGFILADKRGCEIIRPARVNKLAPARRKSLTLKLARSAAKRVQTLSRWAEDNSTD